MPCDAADATSRPAAASAEALEYLNGVQALELSESGSVEISVGQKLPTLPQRPLGRDIWWWLTATRLARVPVPSRLGQRLSQRDVVISGGLKELRRRGVEIRPRVVGASGATEQCGFARRSCSVERSILTLAFWGSRPRSTAQDSAPRKGAKVEAEGSSGDCPVRVGGLTGTRSGGTGAWTGLRDWQRVSFPWRRPRTLPTRSGRRERTQRREPERPHALHSASRSPRWDGDVSERAGKRRAADNCATRQRVGGELQDHRQRPRRTRRR